MKTSIDQFGRVVIPQKIREDLGLIPGMQLDIEEWGQELRIRPVLSEPLVMDKGGVWVYRGSSLEGLNNVVSKDRQNRLQKFHRGFKK